jgi:two-component system response regulator AtoC
VSRLLLVDDDPGLLFTLEEILDERGFDCVAVSSGAEALERLDGVDAVLTDLTMPGMDGLALLDAISRRDATLPVVLLTAHGSERSAVAAMKAGAYDYLTKPFDSEELVLAMARACETRQLRATTRRLEAERAAGIHIIGGSAAMTRLLEAVARVAPKNVTVLVRGETGTGKELIASLLVAESARADKPLVRFNCAAIPAELADAELFGHVRGAFTGAQANRQGFLSRAHGGTLVLDEVGELTPGIQAKLLRALQEGEIQPVGAARVEHVDVRVIACTNRDLAPEIEAGRFRADLYYRLAVIELVVPPLADRREDIHDLASFFARRYADRFGVDVQLAPELLEALARRPWPGNVRELENIIARMVALSDGGVLEVTELEASATPDVSPLSLRDQVERFERGLIKKALEACEANQSAAARALGTSRATLADKIKKYGLAGS